MPQSTGDRLHAERKKVNSPTTVTALSLSAADPLHSERQKVLSDAVKCWISDHVFTDAYNSSKAMDTRPFEYKLRTDVVTRRIHAHYESHAREHGDASEMSMKKVGRIVAQLAQVVVRRAVEIERARRWQCTHQACTDQARDVSTDAGDDDGVLVGYHCAYQSVPFFATRCTGVVFGRAEAESVFEAISTLRSCLETWCEDDVADVAAAVTETSGDENEAQDGSTVIENAEISTASMDQSAPQGPRRPPPEEDEDGRQGPIDTASNGTRAHGAFGASFAAFEWTLRGPTTSSTNGFELVPSSRKRRHAFFEQPPSVVRDRLATCEDWVPEDGANACAAFDAIARGGLFARRAPPLAPPEDQTDVAALGGDGYGGGTERQPNELAQGSDAADGRSKPPPHCTLWTLHIDTVARDLRAAMCNHSQRSAVVRSAMCRIVEYVRLSAQMRAQEHEGGPEHLEFVELGELDRVGGVVRTGLLANDAGVVAVKDAARVFLGRLLAISTE